MAIAVHIIPLDCFQMCFSHSIAFRAVGRPLANLKRDQIRETKGFTARELQTIVSEQLNGVRALRFTGVILNRTEQHMTKYLPGDADRAVVVVDHLPIMTVHKKGSLEVSPNPGEHVENKQAPAHVTHGSDNLAVVRKRSAKGVFLPQQALFLDRAINVLLIRERKFFKAYIERGRPAVVAMRCCYARTFRKTSSSLSTAARVPKSFSLFYLKICFTAMPCWREKYDILVPGYSAAARTFDFSATHPRRCRWTAVTTAMLVLVPALFKPLPLSLRRNTRFPMNYGAAQWGAI